ncbi:hypothetical protein [Myxosarcina sp. GI1(2024)]
MLNCNERLACFGLLTRTERSESMAIAKILSQTSIDVDRSS